jgi:hypothetical protein
MPLFYYLIRGRDKKITAARHGAAGQIFGQRMPERFVAMITPKHARTKSAGSGDFNRWSLCFADRIAIVAALRAENAANARITPLGRNPGRLGRVSLRALGACRLGGPAGSAVIGANRCICGSKKLQAGNFPPLRSCLKVPCRPDLPVETILLRYRRLHRSSSDASRPV